MRIVINLLVKGEQVIEPFIFLDTNIKSGVICPDFQIFTNRNVVILQILLKDLSNKGKESMQDLMKSNKICLFLILLLLLHASFSQAPVFYFAMLGIPVTYMHM